MLVHGDKTAPCPDSGSTSIYAKAPAPKVLLTLLGAPRSPFSSWLRSDRPLVTDFLDGYLKHDRRALRRLGR